MEDSRATRIFLCGFLKDSNETTVPLCNIKRGEVGFHVPSVTASRILAGLVLNSEQGLEKGEMAARARLGAAGALEMAVPAPSASLGRSTWLLRHARAHWGARLGDSKPLGIGQAASTQLH